MLKPAAQSLTTLDLKKSDQSSNVQKENQWYTNPSHKDINMMASPQIKRGLSPNDKFW